MENKLQRIDVILGRNYGPTVEVNGNMHYLSPTNYLLAESMLMHPYEVLKLVEEYPIYKLPELKALYSGEKWIKTKPAFIPNKRELKLLNNPKKLIEIFRKKVQSKDGTYNLIELSGKSIVRKAVLWGSGTLEAEVKSLSGITTTGGNQAYHSIRLNRLGLDENDRINYGDAFCDCADFNYEEVKNAGIRINNEDEEVLLSSREHCKHINAAELILDKEIRGINTGLLRIAGGKLPEYSAMPYTFFDIPSRHIEKLLGEVLVNYYVFNKNLLNINIKITDMIGIYRRHTLKMAERGELTFRATRQRNLSLKSLSKTEIAAKYLVREAKKRLRDQGYNYDGVCLEFKNTEYQTVAQRYIKEDRIISIATNLERPPLFIEKRLGENIKLFNNKIVDGDPFLRVYNKTRSMYKTIDDVTRRECMERVFIPGSYGAKDKINVPYILELWYKNTIKNAKISL